MTHTSINRRFELRRSWLVLTLASAVLGLTLTATLTVQARPDSGETCFATFDDGLTVFSSTDASAAQLAIDAALPGQVLKFAGTCPGAHLVLTKTLMVQGGYTPTDWLQTWPVTQPTTLDGSNSGRVLSVWGNITVTLDGLILTGGEPGYDVGGGLYTDAFSVTVSHSQIVNNHASSAIGCADGFNGGGIYNAGQLLVTDSQIYANSAGNGSADSFNCSPGKGGDGGGIYNAGQLTVIHSNLHNNLSGTGGAYVLHGPWGDNGSGGAIYSRGPLTVSRSLLQHNQTGGGLPFGGWGGGVASISVTHIINSVVSDNQAISAGGGLYLVTEATLNQVTLANNNAIGDASGLSVDGTAWVTNTIVASQSVGVGVLSGAANLDGVLWFGNGSNLAGPGAITVSHAYTDSPAFRASAAGDYHLTASSAAINRGVDGSIQIDLDGEARDVTPDLGAYEYQFPWKCYLVVILR